MSAAPLEYEPALLEAAVLEEVRRREARGELRAAQEVRRASHDLYLLDEAEREQGFAQLYLDAFRTLGFERELLAALGEYPRVREGVQRIQLHRALQRRDEDVDLNAPGGQRLLRMRLTASRFADPVTLRAFTRRQLLHVQDLLDPSFGYVHLARLSDRPAEDGLYRDRYRLFWDLTVAGRLARDGKPTGEGPRLRAELDALYGHAPAAVRDRVFERLHDGARPSHEQLLAAARDTRHLLELAGVPHDVALGPMPGAPCPLCRFPTHAWRTACSPAVAGAIRSHFPDWSAAQAICERCFDLYEMRSAS